jgi:hypothetical protein
MRNYAVKGNITKKNERNIEIRLRRHFPAIFDVLIEMQRITMY